MPAPLISIIIPVYREPDLTKFIQALRESLTYPHYEIIVSDGEPGHSSLQALPDPEVVQVRSTPGRGCGLRDGAKVARGDILLFLHADTRLSKQALESITAALQDEDITGGAFDLAIDNPKWRYRVVEKLSSLRSRLTRIPYGDQAHFVRREVYDRVGGYTPIPLMEDVDFMRRLKRGGFEITILPQPATTSARRWEARGILYTTLRNWYLVTLYYLGVSPATLAKWYR